MVCVNIGEASSGFYYSDTIVADADVVSYYFLPRCFLRDGVSQEIIMKDDCFPTRGSYYSPADAVVGIFSKG